MIGNWVCVESVVVGGRGDHTTWKDLDHIHWRKEDCWVRRDDVEPLWEDFLHVLFDSWTAGVQSYRKEMENDVLGCVVGKKRVSESSHLPAFNPAHGRYSYSSGPIPVPPPALN